MKIIDVEQGSEAWKEARLGIPTSSEFDKIITPAKAELSTQSTKYLDRLVAEWFLGHPVDDADRASQFMERGKELEPDAASWYAAVQEVELIHAGFCVTDDGKAGASPDRLVAPLPAKGGIEIKCPGAAVHMGYVLRGVKDEHKVQVQGQMWVCELEWVDRVFYHPIFPSLVVRTERDDEYIKKLAKAVGQFCERLEEAKAKLASEKAAWDEELRALRAAEAAAMDVPAGIC